MAKKDKTLANAAKIWEAKAKEKANKPKSTPPEAGKAQAEILDVFLGKDHFENKAYEFELKIVGGVNMGRKFTKHLGIEAKTPPPNFTEDDVVGWTVDALSNMGCTSVDRDEVESLAGAIVNITFHKKAGSDAKKWPVIYFNSLDTPAPQDADDDDDEPVAEVADNVEADDDDDFDYIEVK